MSTTEAREARGAPARGQAARCWPWAAVGGLVGGRPRARGGESGQRAGPAFLLFRASVLYSNPDPGKLVGGSVTWERGRERRPTARNSVELWLPERGRAHRRSKARDGVYPPGKGCPGRHPDTARQQDEGLRQHLTAWGAPCGGPGAPEQGGPAPCGGGHSIQEENTHFNLPGRAVPGAWHRPRKATTGGERATPGNS